MGIGADRDDSHLTFASLQMHMLSRVPQCFERSVQKGYACVNDSVRAVDVVHWKGYQLRLVSRGLSEKQTETEHAWSCVGMAS